MRCLTLAELIALEAIIVFLIGYITSIILPEIRSLLGLDPPKRESALAEKVLWIIWVCLILLAVGLIIWFIMCRTESSETGGNPTPSPSPTVQASPTPPGPVVASTPVVVDGTAFTLYVFLRDYHWKAGTVQVELIKKPIPEQQMIDYLTQLSGNIKPADAVICVGTASQDMPKGEPFEEGRALDRAKLLTIWMQPAISQSGRQIAVYKLNLGHYRELPDKDDQRLIIFVAVTKIDPNVSIDDLLSPTNSEALKRKLIEKNFPFNFDAYSRFDLQKNT